MTISELPLEYPIESGASVPKILASEHLLLLFYFAKGFSSSKLLHRDAVSDRGVVIIKFHNYLNFKFGSPGNEILRGHPYYRLGLRPYRFYNLLESHWISELMKISRVHPRHSDLLFEDYRHFVITFHDTMFECIAEDYNVEYSDKSMGEIISAKTKDLILAL